METEEIKKRRSMQKVKEKANPVKFYLDESENILSNLKTKEDLIMRQTKQGKEFEKAVQAVRNRIERQLIKNKLMKKGQAFDVYLNHVDPKRIPINVNVWDERKINILGIYYFYQNGQLKF